MKRRSVIAWILLAAMCLLSACGNPAGSASDEKPGSQDSGRKEPSSEEAPGFDEIGEDGAMICDIGSWQAHQDETFGEVYQRINGGDTADQLIFEVQSESGLVEDPDLIFETFVLLSGLNVYTNHGYYGSETDCMERYTFSWPDGVSCTFCFSDGGVYQTEDLKCYDTFAFVGDMGYEEIREVFLERYHVLEQRKTEGQDGGDAKQEPAPDETLTEDLDFSDGFFEWDADGDGNAEKFEINFYRNGDEAQDVLEITVVSGSALQGAQIVISGAYDITGLTSETDGDGPSLLLSYTYGDYYSHDFPALCRIRLRDGAFETEELDA